MNNFIVAEESELEPAIRQAATESGTVAYAGRAYHFSSCHDEQEIQWMLKQIKHRKSLTIKRSRSNRGTAASLVSPLLELARKKK